LPRGLKYLFVQENMVDNLTVGGTWAVAAHF
jgi:hypothetical protein